MLSPQTSPGYPEPVLDSQEIEAEIALSEEEQLEVSISNMSLAEKSQREVENRLEEETLEDQKTEVVQEQVVPAPQLKPPTKDLFNLYSLFFICKSKDHSERRIRLDFGMIAEVCRVRGQPGRMDATVIVSFESAEDCLKCLEDRTIMTKYPTLGPAPLVKIVPDRDGYFSIEFTNAGMSGVREITNEFSRHGEIVKVQQGGARNAVKRVTVSYADLDSAMQALTHYANSNDVRGIDFVPECVELET